MASYSSVFSQPFATASLRLPCSSSPTPLNRAKMHSIVLLLTLGCLVAACYGAADTRKAGLVDPNTGVPREWEAYKKFCKLTTDPKKDAAQKATFLKTVNEVRLNQGQSARVSEGGTLPADFVGMNLNCHAHMTTAEFRQGATGRLPSKNKSPLLREAE